MSEEVSSLAFKTSFLHQLIECPLVVVFSVLPRPFLQGGTPCLFQEAEMTPCRLLVTPRDALLYFTCPRTSQSAVIGAETMRFPCVGIVIRLIYKNLCYWPLLVYFGMLATDCCITFIQWQARIQELLLCDPQSDLDRYTLANSVGKRNFMLRSLVAFLKYFILC